MLFVPARCTDEFQECDTVINKPFKAGMKAAFRDFIHEDFNSHKEDVAIWSIKLTMGNLKEHIVSFVETGLNAVRTEAYSLVIKNAFKIHGQFEEIRSDLRQLMAAADNLSLTEVPAYEEEMDKVFVIDENDIDDKVEDTRKGKEDSDDESDDESVDKNRNDEEENNEAGLELITLPIVLKPSILLNAISTSVVNAPKPSRVKVAPKRTNAVKSVASKSVKPARGPAAISVKKPSMFLSSKNISSGLSRASLMFGSPVPCRASVPVVTPTLTDPILGNEQFLLDMRYTALTDIENKAIDKLLGDEDDDRRIVTTQYSNLYAMDKRKMLTLNPKIWIVDDVSTLINSLIHNAITSNILFNYEQQLFQVISFYMCLLNDRDKAMCLVDDDRVASFFMDAQFMQYINDHKDDVVANWASKVTKYLDIFCHNKVFIPTNVRGVHWTMIVVNIQYKEIHYYDSMSGEGKEYTDLVKRWLVQEAIRRKKTAFDITEWKVLSREKGVPQQFSNGTECGVFTMMCADFLTDDLPLVYNLSQMSYFRRKIAADILRGNLSYKIK